MTLRHIKSDFNTDSLTEERGENVTLLRPMWQLLQSKTKNKKIREKYLPKFYDVYF